jgi:hypothetical protein
MTIHLGKRLTHAVLLAGLVLPAAALFATRPAHAAPPAPPPSAIAAPAETMDAPVASSDEQTLENFKKTLADYGNFVTLDGYGEVWVPTVTPEGWHPYPPCQWVYAKDIGWYFRDDTPWGAIVHHYGRWSHDAKVGWFWVPDTDWSPGWVVWRDSDKWIGWAPMPPDQEAQKVSLDDFNKDKMWTFMDTQIFMKGCGDTVAAAAVYNETQPVSLFELPRGHIVEIRIVPHWKIKVIRKIIVIDRRCPPDRPNPNRPPLTHRTLYDTLQPPHIAPPVHIERHVLRHNVEHRRHRIVVTEGPRRHREVLKVHRVPRHASGGYTVNRELR